MKDMERAERLLDGLCWESKVESIVWYTPDHKRLYPVLLTVEDFLRIICEQQNITREDARNLWREAKKCATPPHHGETEREITMSEDTWEHRSKKMLCRTCMWFVEKKTTADKGYQTLGRCRKHAPTMSGWPAMYPEDWCGDHKIDETKI